MRKKSGFTMIEQAIMLVPEFENVVRKLEQQVVLRGQSKSTLNNYISTGSIQVFRQAQYRHSTYCAVCNSLRKASGTD
jgi:hypothetical protein